MRTSVTCLLLLLVMSACGQAPVKVDSFAITEQAFALVGQGKYEEAYTLLQPLVAQGDLDAIYRLAELYDYEVQRPNARQNPYFDTEKAREWWYFAAKQGHADAQLALGSNLKSSRNNYRDKPDKLKALYKEACDWYVKAAMQGVTFGTYAVAQCHRAGGFTGQPDYFLSYAWHAVSKFYGKNDTLMRDVDDSEFMRQVAQRGKLTDEQKQQALVIAQDIAKKIKLPSKKK